MKLWLRVLLLLLCGALALAAPALVQTQSPAAPVRVSPASVPRLGSYFSLHRTNMPPLPFLRPEYVELDLPVYWLGGLRFLVDDTSLDWAAIEAERRLLQAAAAMSANSLSLMDGGGAAMMSCSYGSNDLWLEIVAVTNQTAQLRVHTPEAEAVYDLFQTPSLATNSWAWIARGLPGQTWFSVTNLPPGGAFYILGTMAGLDTNGVTTAYRTLVGGDETLATDTDGDDLPDVWEILHFGNLHQDGYGDYDGDAVSNADEFSNRSDPNTIVFSVLISDEYAATNTLPLQIAVQAGVPARMALMVEATNFSGADWLPFCSSASANLGTNDGWHDVWVGLRGRLPGRGEVWSKRRVKLDRTPPQYAISRPSSPTSSVPLVQITGCASEPLVNVRYDLANAVGTQTNLPAFVTEQTFDPATGTLAAAHFQCFDVELAEGDNTITLRACDLAGNLGATNLTITLVADQVPPAVTIGWPQDGLSICGDTFTLDGTLDDISSQVRLELVSGGGETNSFEGLVERTGRFWVENLPLAEGTNWLTLSVTDAWTNTTTTNLTVLRSSLGLTVTPIDPAALGEATTTVSGTVSDADYSVSVNDVPATVYADGTWVAENVPVPPGGVAGFFILARAPGQPPSASHQTKTNIELASVIYVETDNQDTAYSAVEDGQVYDDGNPPALLDAYTSSWTRQQGHQWAYRKASPGWWSSLQYNTFLNWPPGSNICVASVIWPPTTANNLQATPWALNAECHNPRIPEPGGPRIGMEHCEVADSVAGPQVYWDAFWSTWGSGSRSVGYSRTAQTTLRLFTGGKAVPKRASLFWISGNAWAVTNKWAEPPFPTESRRWIDYTNVTVGDLGRLGPNGGFYIALPSGTNLDATPRVAGESFYSFSVEASKHAFKSQCAATVPANRDRMTVGVGEEVRLWFEPPLPTLACWLCSTGSILPAPPNAARTAVFTAPSNAANVNVIVSLPGVAVTNTFVVLEPSGITSSIRGLPDQFFPPFPRVGAGMQMDVVLQPTTVSFDRLEIMEPGEPTTGTGYFAQITPPSHSDWGADAWHPVAPSNKVTSGAFDHVLDAFGWPIGVSGTYTWPISPLWRIEGSSTANSLSGWTDQVFTLSSNGTMRIDKFGHHVSRGPYQSRGTAQ